MLAWLVARENHCIQPISEADEIAEGRAGYRYGPPVASKRLLKLGEAERDRQ